MVLISSLVLGDGFGCNSDMLVLLFYRDVVCSSGVCCRCVDSLLVVMMLFIGLIVVSVGVVLINVFCVILLMFVVVIVLILVEILFGVRIWL